MYIYISRKKYYFFIWKPYINFQSPDPLMISLQFLSFCMYQDQIFWKFLIGNLNVRISFLHQNSYVDFSEQMCHWHYYSSCMFNSCIYATYVLYRYIVLKASYKVCLKRIIFYWLKLTLKKERLVNWFLCFNGISTFVLTPSRRNKGFIPFPRELVKLWMKLKLIYQPFSHYATGTLPRKKDSKKNNMWYIKKHIFLKYYFQVDHKMHAQSYLYSYPTLF